MKRPRLNALRTFEAAARHLSFSNAGDELGVSQAAVSQQIRKLEAYLGASLFSRRNRGLSLTGVGEAYHMAVSEALDRLDAITDQLFPGAGDHVVTVQCTPSVATLWLVPQLALFRSAHPGIDLRIVTLDTRRDSANRPQADLEIATLDPEDADARCRRLLDVVIAPVSAPALLGEAEITHPADVLNFDLLHVLGYRDDWHRWFRTVGLGTQKVPAGPSFDSSLIALEAAVEGDGIMLGRIPFIEQHLRSGALIRPFGGDHSLTASYFLRMPGTTKTRRDVTLFADWLTSVARAGQ